MHGDLQNFVEEICHVVSNSTTRLTSADFYFRLAEQQALSLPMSLVNRLSAAMGTYYSTYKLDLLL